MTTQITEPLGRLTYRRNTLLSLWEKVTEAFRSLITRSNRIPFNVDPTTLTYDFKVTMNGVVTKIIMELCNYTNTITTTLSILDDNGITHYGGAAVVQNANYVIRLDEDLSGTYTIRLTLGGASGGNGTDFVTLYLR